MIPRLKVVLTTLCTIIMVSILPGCSSGGTVYKDYTLVAAAPVVATRDGLPATLGVFPVSVPGWLDRGNITLSDGGVVLRTYENDHWGEPLPELLTQAMVENLRRQAGSKTWVSSGPWVGNQRPAVVVFANVQSIMAVQQQLQVSVAWTLQDSENQVTARQEKVYALAVNGPSMQEKIETLSQVWGLVAKDVVETLVQNASM